MSLLPQPAPETDEIVTLTLPEVTTATSLEVAHTATSLEVAPTETSLSVTDAGSPTGLVNTSEAPLEGAPKDASAVTPDESEQHVQEAAENERKGKHVPALKYLPFLQMHRRLASVKLSLFLTEFLESC